MRLIDADKLKVDIESFFADGIHIYDSFVELIDEQPTIEPERKRGRWERQKGGVFWCSNCHSGYKNQPKLMGKPMFEFCPICGADMRGEK